MDRPGSNGRIIDAHSGIVVQTLAVGRGLAVGAFVIGAAVGVGVGASVGASVGSVASPAVEARAPESFCAVFFPIRELPAGSWMVLR